MQKTFYHLFDTVLGVCGIAWVKKDAGDISLTFLQLPDTSAAATEKRLLEKVEGEKAENLDPVPAEIIEKVRVHLTGVPREFDDIPVNLSGIRPFSLQVYQACRKIPSGETTSYGELARNIGRPGAARAVGRALAANPVPLIIPCHRVLSAGGKPVGFTAPGGVKTKLRILAIEGVKVQ